MPVQEQETAALPPDELDDVAIGVAGSRNGSGLQIDPVAMEAAVTMGRPLATFRVRRPGTEPPDVVELRIYAKSIGMMDRADAARVAYFDALNAHQATIGAGWQFWRRRRKAVEKALRRVTEARFVWLRTILADPFDDEKHQEVDPVILAAIGYDQFCEILGVYAQGVSPDRMLVAMDPDYEEKKRPGRKAATSRAG